MCILNTRWEYALSNGILVSKSTRLLNWSLNIVTQSASKWTLSLSCKNIDCGDTTGIYVYDHYPADECKWDLLLRTLSTNSEFLVESRLMNERWRCGRPWTQSAWLVTTAYATSLWTRIHSVSYDLMCLDNCR